MNGSHLVWHQLHYDQKRFWRDPAGVFFAVAFPLVFLLVFVAVLGNHEEAGRVAGRTLRSADYYLPAVLTIALVSADFINLSISITASRERGVLKRVRGTPLPFWVFVAGRVATSFFVSLMLVTVTVITGALFFGVSLTWAALPAALLALVVGAACLCSLGFALTALTRSEGAAAALANVIALPLYFVSGLFARNDVIPAAVRHVADIFPVAHLFAALAAAFDPTGAGGAVRGWDLAVMGLWGAAGLLLALRFFHWTPREG